MNTHLRHLAIRSWEVFELFEQHVDTKLEKCRFERPGACFRECELIRVKRLFFAIAVCLFEKLVNGLVETTMEDRLETAFSCVDLLYWIVRSVSLVLVRGVL